MIESRRVRMQKSKKMVEQNKIRDAYSRSYLENTGEAKMKCLDPLRFKDAGFKIFESDTASGLEDLINMFIHDDAGAFNIIKSVQKEILVKPDGKNTYIAVMLFKFCESTKQCLNIS